MSSINSTTMTRKKIHTISLLVSNKSGMLVRISTLFSRRGFNIESLVVSPALDGRFSRMTITAHGDVDTLDQIVKQLNKLVDVLHASDHIQDNCIEKEFALIKIRVPQAQQTQALTAIQHFKAQTVDIAADCIVIQVAGNTEKIDSMVEFFNEYGILELIRTGKIVMARGTEGT